MTGVLVLCAFMMTADLQTKPAAAEIPFTAGVYHLWDYGKFASAMYFSVHGGSVSPGIVLFVETFRQGIDSGSSTEYAVTLSPGARPGEYAASYKVLGTWGMPDQDILPATLGAGKDKNGMPALLDGSGRSFTKQTPAELIKNTNCRFNDLSLYASEQSDGRVYIRIVREKDGSVKYFRFTRDTGPVELIAFDYGIGLDRNRPEQPHDFKATSVRLRNPDGKEIYITFDLDGSPVSWAGAIVGGEEGLQNQRFWHYEPVERYAPVNTRDERLALRAYRMYTPRNQAGEIEEFQFCSKDFPDGLFLKIKARNGAKTGDGFDTALLRADGTVFAAIKKIEPEDNSKPVVMLLRYPDGREIRFETKR
jgi:hypothetical protein